MPHYLQEGGVQHHLDTLLEIRPADHQMPLGAVFANPGDGHLVRKR